MKTREIIIDSAFKLLCEKKFSKISVQDIIDKAGCSRFTFYKYFSDKYELMHLYYRSAINSLLFEQYDGSNFVTIQAEIFQFVRENGNYFSNVKEYSGVESFWNFLTDYTWEFFKTVRYINLERNLLNEKEKMEMHFVVEGAVSVFRKYVEQSQLPLSPLEISGLLCQHYPKEYYTLSKEKVEEFRKIITLKNKSDT